KDSIVKYFDANNQPIKGISEYRYQYNNNGQMVSESYYDGNNRPVLNEKGIHKIITTYNERMYFVREQYFDIYNKPVNDMDGLGIYEVQYDKDNYLQYQLYYDKNKNPILYEGVHKKEFRRNEAGIIFRITNLDTIGNKIDGKDGIADIYMDLYPSGMVSKISYFNKDAEYVPDEDGFSEYEYHNYLNGLY